MRKLIIDGNAVYELDENCMLKKKLSEKQNEEEKKNLKNKKKKTKLIILNIICAISTKK